MSTYSDAIETPQGRVHFLTKTRWMGFLPMPHTSVTPDNAADLKRLGTLIKWNTDDPSVLSRLHQSIIAVVRQFGIAGLVEIANSAKMAEQVWQQLHGASDTGLQEVLKEAARDGHEFPLPQDVLQHIKSFM